MSFLQPAPVVGRASIKRLAHQLSRTLSSPLAYSTSTRAPAAQAALPSVGRQCVHAAVKTSQPPLSVLSPLTRTRAAQQFRHPTAPFARSLTNSASNKTTTSAPTLDSKYNPDPTASDTSQDAKAKSKSFPETSSKSVAYWLLGSAASVFGIVVFGGLTRLTESGYAY